MDGLVSGVLRVRLSFLYFRSFMAIVNLLILSLLSGEGAPAALTTLRNQTGVDFVYARVKVVR